MKHVHWVTKRRQKLAQVETTGLSLGQILTLIANILSIVAQAITAKEGTTTSTS